MRVEIITLENGEQLPLLVDADGLPVPSANEWLLTRRDRAANTLTRNLSELIPLFGWLERQQFDLWERISSGKGFTEAEIRGSLLEYLRRARNRRSVHRLSVAPDTYNKRLDTIADFLKSMFYTCLSHLPTDDNKYDRIQANLDMMLSWFSSGRMSPEPAKRTAKGLETDERDYLLRCLDPSKKGYDSYGKRMSRKTEASSESYEVSQALRHRNYVMTVLMLFCGLRRGELLSLRVDDVVTGSAIPQVNVIRRPPDPHDARQPRPQVKRLSRVLPIAPYWARPIDEYITEWRDVLLARSGNDTDYLMLARSGRPISLSQVDKIYRRIRDAHSDNLPSHLSPHALRHTFSQNVFTDLKAAGLTEEQVRRQVALLRGDASEASQDEYLRNEVAKQASSQLLRYQNSLSESFKDVPF
ncbi:tyrosine-type recombinase/integrase [Spiribacter halobius]|uniref:Integrase n=1 Tax=Sediminicurvatus halobius TaxID=2182432 RepID=A0A2U2N4V5_9GAMM|nr:site-specific integrase [Spiribacter halobius]PWG64123.1 integrase [Spiribacter halobius]UEX78754.1 site-specific integrase [Spiribacter halobius]